MKKTMVSIILAATMASSVAMAKVPETRTMTGKYYDYMCIETKDGNEWLLSDEQAAHNPYMRKRVVRFNGKKRVEYVPKFRNGQCVRVKFDTMGTNKVTDDRIISVKAIRK